MKAPLLHLSETKQEQIFRIVQVIMDIFLPEKIILHGSYARGACQAGYYVDINNLESVINRLHVEQLEARSASTQRNRTKVAYLSQNEAIKSQFTASSLLHRSPFGTRKTIGDFPLTNDCLQ